MIRKISTAIGGIKIIFTFVSINYIIVQNLKSKM